MKKWISLLLITVLSLSLYACNNSSSTIVLEQPTETNSSLEDEMIIDHDTEDASPPNELQNATMYRQGDTVATDIFEFTLDRAQFAIALTNSFSTNNANDYAVPKEYSAEEDANNTFVASIGHTFVYVSFTCHNLNRTSVDFGGSFNPKFSTVEYNDESFDDIMDFTAERTGEHPNWMPYSSSNVLIGAGETISMRGKIDLAVEANSLNDTFYIIFHLPNSKGETEDFVYTVTEADVAAAIEREALAFEAAKEAAEKVIAERKAEADSQTVITVTELLQGDWEYTDNSSGFSVLNELTFRDNSVTVTSTSMGLTLVKEGTYIVAQNDIFIDFEDESHIDCFLPYSLENGELTIFPIENIEE